ncbi:MAG TPA: N,N-dimethylformamidase beta subunit family domain-containing protein [Gaiellaceae bacterium]|nr:N,N-dimethylformamidase beta subunit family domain-containing protein [Gaiellaceae bacterium]
MKFAVVAAALAVVAVPGAAARSSSELRLLGISSLVISPNGNGVNDTLRVHVAAPPGSVLGLRAYAWGGRLAGWKRIRTGVTVRDATVLSWNGTSSTGHPLADGTYVVTVCSENPGRLLPAKGVSRPGAAEASVRRPPWLRSGCVREPRVVRVERLAAFVDSTGSFRQTEPVPLVVAADRGEAESQPQQDCLGPNEKEISFREIGSPFRVALGSRPGLYHVVARDRAGGEFRAPLVVRAPVRLDRPEPHTALIVWSYLTWRAYNAYDADLNGIPDSWYQFWRQRRVSLRGPILRNGVEDDHAASLPFSRWLCARPAIRTQHVTDVELGRLPLETLKRYSAIVFPGHTEYYEPATYDLLRRYRDGRGNLVFLQANPFYRQVRLDAQRNAMVMTDYDAREGRSDFALAGVGYDGCCFPRARAAPYTAAKGRAYERVRWLFRNTGIGPGQRFGVAASESDRIDPELTPRDHVVAAQAVIEGKRGAINATMVWSHAGRGSVFATGNYTFLRMGQGLTYKLLDNVWRKLVG